MVNSKYLRDCYEHIVGLGFCISIRKHKGMYKVSISKNKDKNYLVRQDKNLNIAMSKAINQMFSECWSLPR